MSLFDALWPRHTPQSECALALLERMEDTGVIPEAVTHNTLIRVCFYALKLQHFLESILHIHCLAAHIGHGSSYFSTISSY